MLASLILSNSSSVLPHPCVSADVRPACSSCARL